MTPVTICLHPYRQHLVFIGAAACVVGNIGASFAANVWMLVLCQGVIYGIGFLIISYSVFSMLNEWFIRRRGLAYGILFVCSPELLSEFLIFFRRLSAAGIGGLGLPFLLQTLLDDYGHSITLRIYSVATVRYLLAFSSLSGTSKLTYQINRSLLLVLPSSYYEAVLDTWQLRQRPK